MSMDDRYEVTDESTDVEAERPTRPAPARERRDPVTQLLGFGIGLAVIGVLIAVTYVLYAGLLAPQAPRTVVERQVMLLERYTEENPTSAAAWADYVAALTVSGQYTTAEQVLEDVEALVEQEPALMNEKARLLIETGEQEAALGVLDESIELATQQRQQRLDELAEQSVVGMLQDEWANWIVGAALLKMSIQQDQGSWQEVVDTATFALEENATMADVMVARGYAYIELGDETAAEEDFRAALLLVPGDVDARRGLKELGLEAGESGE